MKSIPVLKSKLTMPQLPPSVAVTERLQRLSSQMYERQVVIISAPAGYGKTTLMVTALSRYQLKGCRICWYRLDEEDRDLAVFYTHLVETLFPEEEGIWAEPRNHLADCGDVFAQHQYLNALFCQELWAFHNLRPDVKTFIVFDDFQQVWDTNEITGAIQFLIDNLPDKCFVVVSSRWSTGLLAGKRMLEKNILEITRSDLCFSEAELAGLIEKRFGLTPDQDLLRKVILHTEGWAAGIVLVCQMLNLNGTGQAGNLLDRIGNKEPLFQYMVAEVLKTVDDRLLRFLVRTAILQEFTAADAGAIFGEDGVAELLRQCERQGLFIQKVAGHPEAIYHFHPLFRDALRQIQPQHLSPEETNNLHLKAAAYYIDHHNFDRAIEYFIACGSVDQAVALVTRESARLIALESLDQIRLWFRILPEAVVSGNGHLLFFQSYIYQHRDVGSALSLLEQALAIFQQSGDSAMQIHTLLAMARLYAQRQDMSGLRKIHALTPDLYQKVHGQPLVNMLAVFDFLVAVVEGRLARGAALYQRIGMQALTDEWQWAALFYSIMMYCLRGELNRAVSQGREALKLEMVGRSNLLKGYTLIYYSIVLQMRDESDPLMIDELMTIGAKYEYKYMMGCSKRLTASVYYRRHDLEGALEQLEASTGYFEDLGNKALISSNRLWRCLWLCEAQPASELLADAQKALKYLIARRPDGYCLHEIGKSVFGAVAREAGAYELAEKNLAAVVKSSRAKGAKQILAGSCLHLAKLYFDTGNPVRGEDYLRQAFTLAVDNNYVMFWDMHFPTLVEMAARCVKSRIHADYAQALIARYYGSKAAEFLGRTAALTADDHLKDFAGAFLSRYGTHDESQAPRISVNLFGRFSITVNGITIPKNEWKTKKIAGVLKFLVAHRGRPVFKDRLMEVFWPGVDKKSAYMSLRAAYYELKKVLRKYGVATEGETWFLNEKRDSLEVRACRLLTVDVDSFLALSNELKTLPPNKNGSGQKITILERMVDLYRGDYLEEDIYEDWTFAEREELKTIYFGSAIELADIYAMNGDKRKAEKLLLKILAMDSYNEEACLCLLKLYIATNQKGRAVKLYSNFVNRFEKELNIKPDKGLTYVFKE